MIFVSYIRIEIMSKRKHLFSTEYRCYIMSGTHINTEKILLDPNTLTCRINVYDFEAILSYQRDFPQEYAGCRTSTQILSDIPIFGVLNYMAVIAFLDGSMTLNEILAKGNVFGREGCESVLQMHQFNRLFNDLAFKQRLGRERGGVYNGQLHIVE